MNIFKQLSNERKALQADERLPTWFTTHGWQMFSQKYLYNATALDDTYQRIAKTAASHMPEETQREWEMKFFDILWKGWLACSTPVLANMGTDRGCPVSCSGQDVGDSIYQFYGNRLETAVLTKNGFGTSAYLGGIRERGQDFSGGGKTSGTMPVFKMFVQDMRDVSQGSARRGAWAGYLDIDHGDFWEVANHVQAYPDDFNVGWNISEAFINRLNQGDQEALARYQRAMKVRALTGKGYFYFPDKVAGLQPKMYEELGLRSKASNLCTEVTLHADEDHTFTCVLSSMNLAKYDEWKDTDAVFTATVFLDCVASEFIKIGKTKKGLEKAVQFTEKGRALGLGALGFHTYLQSHNIPFESIEATYKNAEIFKHLDQESRYASEKLAELLGEPEWCEGHGVRNTHRCVSGDTRILTSLGQRKIKECVGMDIEVWNGNKYSKVVPFETGVSDILRVEFSNGMYLDCTPDHKFLIMTAQRTTQNLIFNNEPQTVEAAQLRVGDCLPKFPVEAAEASSKALAYAYTAGLFCADGSISNAVAGKYPRNELRLYGPKQDLAQYVEWKSTKTWGSEDLTRGYLPDDLLPKHTVPFEYDLQSRLEWLAGLIDGDGCSSSKGVSISMKSEQFAIDVALLVQSLGGEISITKATRSGGFNTECPIYWVVTISLFSLGTEILKDLPTKRVKINSLKVQTKVGKTRYPFVTKITSKEPVMTYCFTEPTLGLGVFNGMLTKQCAIAPNTTSALICGGVSQGIEPVSANVFIQNSAGGDLERINPEFLKLLKAKDQYTKEIIESVAENYGSVQHLDFLTDHEKLVFKTAYEIDQKVIIRLAAQRQKFIDQAQSINLFFDANEDEGYISEVHQEAFINPYIKSLYYMRTLAGVQASKDECIACEG